MAETKSDNNDEEVLRNPPELDGVPDLSQLIYLDMPNVLHNLEYRYSKMPNKHCYTSISSILLAINPYEHLPIYGQDVINEFHNAAKKGRQVVGRPHPYGVSARAYMRMIQRKCNQSVIVCGESGAGKTETTKLLMRYLAMTAPISTTGDNMNQSSIEEQIIAASPILEAYGNAKTVMNNNSSRFGKFTKLLYHVPDQSQSGNILGSSLETYLLEKSRVVFQALNERNYHIFYFLHEGLGKNNSEYGLETIENFNYVNQGKCFTPFKDKERFQELQESLDMFRINKDVQEVLWKLTAGVMNLGNINFMRTGDGFTDLDKKSMKYLQIVADLWGLKASELEKRLTTKSLKINRNEIVQKVQFDNAVANRDSIAKGIYENIFLWLCKRINAELLVENSDDDMDMDETKTDEENGKYFIGILDVFGFENFYFNSLEQFCINYTNEKLQQYFNFHIIASEQEEYLKESVFWKPLTIPDNEEYIQLVENNKMGFFTLLDSACNGPSKNDTTAFMQTLFKKHKDNKVLHQKTKPGGGNWRGQRPTNSRGSRRRGGAAKFAGFMINHFADDVTYDISKFLIKNSEAVHGDTNKMIKKSSQQIFKEINGVDGSSKKKKKSKKKKSVTAVFYSGIKRLMKSLNQTEPYFVRCINPNKQKSSKVWTEKIVEHQLRCGGLLEALRVLKLGYPTRVPYKLLYEKYHSTVTNPLIKNMNPEAFSTSLLIAFDVNAEDYELGLTKIFFKPSKAAILDTIMSQAGKPLTAQQNEKITKYIVGKRCRQIIGTLKAGMMMIKMIRMKRAAKEWQEKGRIAAILGGTVMKHLFMARKQIKERKEKEGAIMMQTYFRSMYERRHYISKIDKVKKATQLVQIAYKSMKQRQGLQLFLDAQVEKTKAAQAEAARIKAAEAAKAAKAAEAAAQAATSKPVVTQPEAKPVPEPEPQPEPQRATTSANANKSDAIVIAAGEAIKSERKEPELTREERLEIEREKARIKKDEEDERLRKQIQQIKEQQERVSIERVSSDDGRVSIETSKNSTEIKKRERAKKAEKNKREREKADKEARRKIAAQRKKRRNRRYKVNPGDHTDYDTDSSDDDEYETDPEPSDDEEEEDVATLLPKFNKIAAMGQLFFRHAGARSRNKPQDRVVKLHFDSHGKPKEISWGSGSRHIYFKDVLYVAKGHWTPVFDVRKDVLDKKKCFSVVSKDGKTLDLEGYTENVAELWVKGLRKLLGQTDEKAQRMAEKNFKNLVNASKKPRPDKAGKRQINDIMRLQQDLFIMSTHTVFRNLEEERIWVINQTIREKFSPKQMYQVALKADIPWRQWQQWIRERITTYCRENNLVNINNQTGRPATTSFNNNNNNNNNNVHHATVSMSNVFQAPHQIPTQPQHQQTTSMFNIYPNNSVPSYNPYQAPPQFQQRVQNSGYYGGNDNNGLHNFSGFNDNQQQQKPQAPRPTNGNNFAEEEKCTLM